MGLASMVRWSANTQDGFDECRDKRYPMCTMTYTAVFFNVVGLYFCWRSWTSCLDTWHHGFYQIPTDKKCQTDGPCRNLIMGRGWIFQQDNDPQTNLKTTQEWVTVHKSKQASAMAIPVL